jgi:hypothetical protein
VIRLAAALLVMLTCISSCKDQGDSLRTISPDEQLFNLITRTDPGTYSLFPGVDSVARGTLNGSTAHQPFVRVSMNAIAYSSLRGDTLPAGERFPEGSVIVKQIKIDGQPILYAVMYKDSGNEFSNNGWMWAEFYPDGSPFISVARGGTNCVGCHSREQGPQHDYVRTFERRH